MTIFGQIITATDVREALETTIRAWSPDYLAEVGEQHGRLRTALPGFRSYVAVAEINQWPSDQLPSCVIVAPGTADEPVRRPQGYDVGWVAGVAAVVLGRTREEARLLAELYAGALRTLVAHHPSLGGFAESTDWGGERYDDLFVPEDNRTICSCTVQFTIYVNSVIDLATRGPAAPSPDVEVPPDDAGTVQTVEVDTTLEEELTP